MKEKMTIFLGIGIVVTMLVTMFLYMSNMGEINISEIVMVLSVAIIVIGSSWMLLQRVKNLKACLPAKDEMAVKINYKAGFYAFIASIWTAVGGMWINIWMEEWYGFSVMTVNHMVALVVLIPGITFIALYIYFSKKGMAE